VGYSRSTTSLRYPTRRICEAFAGQPQLEAVFRWLLARATQPARDDPLTAAAPSRLEALFLL
jgi:hypothetical protein